jgi:integrase
MSRQRKLEPVFIKSRNRWKLDVPASQSETNKRLRYWFATREAARDYAAKHFADEPSPGITPSLAMKADEARAILEPWNLDLVQGARELSAALEAIGGAGSLIEAARAYRTAHDARTASKPLGEAVALFLDSRADLRDTTLKSYGYTLSKVLVGLHAETMADLTTADIEAILATRAPTARAMHRRNLRTFWRWASTAPRQWAGMATVDALEAIRQSNDADITILTPGDAQSLMRGAEAEGPAAAAAYAIAIFGGVRMAELGKLTWGDVGADTIEIGRSIAKKHSRRLIPICPTLRAWIDATRGESPDDSLIVPPNWADVSKAVRRRAGWAVEARTLTDPPKPSRGEWPANGCRHTCASVQVAIGTPLEELVFKFGHSGGHDLLRAHYVSRLTKKDALAILAIGPNGSKIPHVAVA